MIDRSKLSNSFEFVVTTPRVAVGEHKKTTVAQQEVVTHQVERLEPAPKPAE